MKGVIEIGELSFRSEWQDAPGVCAAELRATWAWLEIWVGDACVTRVEDESLSERRSIFVSLYPLAEWIMCNWWFLLAHGRPARVKSALWTYSLLAEEDAALYAWLRHHNFRGAGEGFLWPDLTCVPEGEYPRVVWRSGRVSGGSAFRYTSSGEVFVESGLFVQALRGFVESVITRLDEQGVTATKLHEEWKALRDATAEEAEFCYVAARLGYDPFDMDDELAGTLERAGSKVGW